MARLVVLSEGLTGLTHELGEDKVTIGRLEDNVFQIAEASVSSHHCEIFRRDQEFVLKDLESTNGTFISGKKVTEEVIIPGQILRLGKVEIRLETKETAAAAASDVAEGLDQTRMLPRGVKLNELEQGTKNVDLGGAFKRQSNKVNMVFIGIGITLMVVIIVLLGWAIARLGS